MRKTLIGIVAASAVCLASCTTQKKESTVPRESGLQSLAQEVYSPAEDLPDCAYYLRIGTTTCRVSSRKECAKGGIETGEIEVNALTHIERYCDYGKDGKLNECLIGRSTSEGVVFESQQLGSHHQIAYELILQKAKEALDAQKR